MSPRYVQSDLGVPTRHTIKTARNYDPVMQRNYKADNRLERGYCTITVLVIALICFLSSCNECLFDRSHEAKQ